MGKLCVILLCLLVFHRSSANPDELRIGIPNLLVGKNNSIVQSVDYQSPQSLHVNITVVCRQVYNKDTALLYHFKYNKVALKKGFHTLQLDILKPSSPFTSDPSFIKAVQTFGQIPAGVYWNKVVIHFDSSDLTKEFLVIGDSTLKVNSNLRRRLNKMLTGVDPSQIVQSSKARDASISRDQAEVSMQKVQRKLKRSGIISVTTNRNGKIFANLYSDKWFLGRYELASTKALQQRVAAEYNSLTNSPSSLVNDNLEGFTGIASSMKDLSKNDDDKYLTGNIDVNSFMGTQEPNAQEDNNFLELLGSFQTEVFDIPVSVEGFYTTQDRQRRAKASYLRIHYDVEKNKEKLSKLVRGYKSKYAEAVSKGNGLQSIYQGYVNNLIAEQRKLEKSFNEYGINESDLKGNDTKGNLPRIDSATMLARLSNSTSEDVQTARRKKDSVYNVLKKNYERYQENEQKIGKYSMLLEQYKTQLSLDSGIVGDKIDKLQSGEDLTCKDMAKAAAGLLPEGKAKKFIFGLTHLDVGIINQYESDYTASGQTLKGGSLGYDFGFAKTGVSLGRTEYVSRDGNVDQYSSLTVRSDFKPLLKQKFGLIYYTYSPSKKMLQEDNFVKETVSTPSFVKPVHIVSVTHEGIIRKNLSLQNEVAASYKESPQTDILSLGSMAMKTSLAYVIPKTTAELKGEWEHVGRDFENSSLPYMRAATERYTLAAKSDFFKSFLTVGVQYNFLTQETFSSTGYSTKWGFDVKTNSKRYPNVFISYKPFTTFRAYNDTFAVQQRPLLGEVWIVKGSYQIKKKNESHRFMMMFNQNSTTTVDTQSYLTKTFQAGYIYLTKRHAVNINAGWMQMPLLRDSAHSFEHTSNPNSYFVSVSLNRTLNQHVTALIGQDVATAYYGLQRLSTTVGVGYAIKKLSLLVRLQTRYSYIQPNETVRSMNLWQGQLGVNWRFRTKIFSKDKDH